MTLDGPGIAAIIVGIATGVSIIIGAIRVQNTAARKRDTPTNPTPVQATPAPVHELPPVPSTFDPEQVLEYLKQIREDNVDLRRRDVQKDAQIVALQRQLTEMGDELKLRNRVQEAFSRYLLVMYRAWNRSTTPPLPEGDDLVLLRDFIPRQNVNPN